MKRCTSIGRTNKPVLMGTRHEGTLPRCLCHEIGVADVTAALTQQDHDLVALVLIAAEDNELAASAGASSSGGGGGGSGPTTQSILDSHLGSLLDTGGVSATAELILFRQKVLLAEGGSRRIGATEEGRFGGGIFLSTAMIKNHYRGAAQGALLKETKANGTKMLELCQEMVNDGLLKAVHVHQTTANKQSRSVWLECIDLNDLDEPGLQDFVLKLRGKAGGTTVPAYANARRKETATAQAGANTTTVSNYLKWQWPGP